MEGKLNLEKLATRIGRYGGKKSHVKIGDIYEILGVLADIIYAERGEGVIVNTRLFQAFFQSGRRRAEQRRARDKRDQFADQRLNTRRTLRSAYPRPAEPMITDPEGK